MRRLAFVLSLAVGLSGACQALAASGTQDVVCETLEQGSSSRLFPLMGVAVEQRATQPQTRLGITLRWPAFAHVSELSESVGPAIDVAHQTATRKLGFSNRLRHITVEFGLPSSPATARTERVGPGAVVIRLPLGLTPEQLRAALAHQVAHAVLLTSRRDAPDWWHEATATWIAECSGLAAPASREAVVSLLEAEQSPSAPTVGAALLSYLSERFGPYEAVRIWDLVTVRAEQDPLVAVAELAEERGGSLREELESFACWVLARGLALDPDSLARVGDSLPALVERRVGPDVPFALSFLRFPAPGTPAGLRVQFSGEAGHRWWVALVTLSALDGMPEERSSLAVSPMAPSEGVVPASEVGDVVMAVVKLANASGRESSFVVEAGPVESYPFVLDELELDPVPGGMHLSWTSQLESDVYAWRILRREAGAAAYTPVDGGTIPAAGSGTHYSFTDARIVPGQVYSYVIEAVTRLGFSDRTQVVGARAR